MSAESGLLVVDKPSGPSSSQVVGWAKRICHTKKVGHAGTLDPMATGVLVLGVNKATRLLGHLALTRKSYQATIRLGETTTTDDAEGEVVWGQFAADVTQAAVDEAMTNFRGQIMQVPSAVSAIKVHGQRAYAMVRKGLEVELEPRPVEITRFEVMAAQRVGDWLDLEVTVDCSSGTYIRALARDLGQALGVGGHLRALRRTQVGPFNIAYAVRLANPKECPSQDFELLSMADAAILVMEVVEVDEDSLADVRYGRELDIQIAAAPTGVIGPDGQLIGLYKPGIGDSAGKAVPVAVLI